MPYLLTRVRDKDFSARIRLPEATVILGRSPKASVRIEDPSVSKIHASMTPIEGTTRYKLEDLGSRNGIVHGGLRRKALELDVGDEFKLGNVLVVLCGEGPETFPIPDEIPRPTPENFRGDAPDSSVKLWNRSERNLLIGFAVIAVALGFTVWSLRDPEPEAALPRSEPAGSEVSSSRSSQDQGTRSSTSTAHLGGTTTFPGKNSEASARSAAGSLPPWTAAASAFDRTCAGGCHLTNADLDLERGTRDELGRWERNLLYLRSHASFEKREGEWWLAAMPGVAAHAEALHLGLDADESHGLDVALRTRGRLLVGAVSRPVEELPSLTALDSVSDQALERLQRCGELVLGRRPTIRELATWSTMSLAAIVKEARARPEFWRERARRVLVGRRGFPATGAFALPPQLLPDEVPVSALEWGDTLARVVDRSGAPSSSTPRPPAPTRGDAEYDAWLELQLAAPPLAVRLDVSLRSVWSVVLGRAPDEFEEQCLLEVGAAGLEPALARRMVVRTLLYGPAFAVPPPQPGQDAAWVAQVARWVGGLDVADDTARELARRLFDSSVDPRIFVEECLCSPEARPVGSTAQAEAALEGVLRIEAWCGFPVRSILRDPQKIPSLWKRLERATLQTFPADAVPLVAVHQKAFRLPAGKAPESQASRRVILSHLSLVRDVGGQGRRGGLGQGSNIRVADGMLLPGLRRLADQLGEPRVASVPDEFRKWVRRQVGFEETTGAELLIESAVGESNDRGTNGAGTRDARWTAGAFRLQPGGAASHIYQPGARTLLLALAELSREAAAGAGGSEMLVWLPIPKGPGDSDRHWELFMTTLDLLTVRFPSLRCELWLWSPDAEGSGTETIRVQWGPGLDRGWVHNESEPARSFHPILRRATFFTPDSAPDASSGDSGPK